MQTTSRQRRSRNPTVNNHKQQQREHQEIPEELRDLLVASLEANRKAQRNIFKTLEVIGRRKAENRKQAARCMQQLKEHWDALDAPKPCHVESEKPTKQEWKMLFTPKEDSAPQSVVNLVPPTTLKRNIPSYTKRGPFCYDPDRGWTRSFFVDPTGSSPEPNPDLIERQEIMKATFFHHMSPPFTAKEDAILKKSVIDTNAMSNDEANGENNKTNETSPEQWAMVAAQMVIVDTSSKKTARANAEEPSFRAADECEIRYGKLMQSPKPRFTKDDCLYIMEQAHIAEERRKRETVGYYLDWENVASSINDSRNDEADKLSAWQCLHMYETQLKAIHAEWTAAEDKMLLSGIAALGPQQTVDFNSVMFLSTLIGHTKNLKQILARLNQSLLNPRLRRTIWSKDDQRKLVLCMKVYQTSPSPTLKAAKYHFPYRHVSMVMAKWNRSLNPETTTLTKFSAEEDSLLLKIIKERQEATSGPTVPVWIQIRDKHFPRRSCLQIQRRWVELAGENEVTRTFGQRVMSARINKRQTILRPEDFVVQAVSPSKKRRKTK